MFSQLLVMKFVMVVLMMIILLHDHNYGVNGDSQPQVPCLYIFGDSLSDNGNNNKLPTLSKANYKPYEIDFSNPNANNAISPTGRFTNGRTIIDIIGQLLGFDDFIPPFANTTGYDIVKGVNYASGGCGILPESGKYLGECISLDKQIDNHQIIISKIKNRTKNDYLKKCLYHITIGNNDYLQNYLLPTIYNTSHLYTPQQFAELLIQKYEDQVLRLYSNSSARKVALVGLGQLGSTPAVIALYGRNGTTKVNQKVQLFNQNLISLVHKLNTKFSDAKFIYVNTSQIQSSDNLSSLGITNFKRNCCPTTTINLCIPSSATCNNRTSYFFWDKVHPSEAVNKFTANRSYTSLHASDSYPIDVKQLAQLQL